ncbi:reverse transcriptase domain-containing protein [Tanacetum coccineum]
MARTPLIRVLLAVSSTSYLKKLGGTLAILLFHVKLGLIHATPWADLGASIYLCHDLVWKIPLFPNNHELGMTLELADHSISEPIGIAEDVYVTVGKFQFPADFVVVDFEPDPCTLLILGRSFLKDKCDLDRCITDGEITLHEYSQEVLGFSSDLEWQSHPYYESQCFTYLPTLTPFGDSDFLLFRRSDSFLLLEGDPSHLKSRKIISEIPKILIFVMQTMKNLQLLSPRVGNHGDLPPHLENAFLEGATRSSLEYTIREDVIVEVLDKQQEATNAPPSSSTSSSSNFEFQQMAAALEDKMTLTFRNEMNEMKNMMKALVPTPIPIKAVEERNGNNGNQVNHGANSGLTQQAQAYQAPSTQVPVTYARFEAYTKANDVTLNNLQKNLNDFKREQQDFQNEQRIFSILMLNINVVKAITARSGLAYDGPLPPYASSLCQSTMRMVCSKVLDFTKSGDSTSIISDPPSFTPFEGRLLMFTLWNQSELSQKDGPNFKVNGHRVKHYFGEDVPNVIIPDVKNDPP